MLSPITATAPSVALDRFVEAVRAMTPGDDPGPHAWLPDGRTTLVFRVLDGGRRGDVCVAGPRTRALFKSLRGVTRAAIIQFKPGWSVPVLGVAAGTLTDHIIPLEDIWGRAGDELYAELAATRALPELVACVGRAVARHSQPWFEPSTARLARRAARLLEAPDVRVASVAAQLGVTARHLRRVFVDNLGVGPKEFARAARLQRAVRLAATSSDWGRIATDAGYYDQAHFITDFRQLVGVTPTAFLRRAAAPRSS